MDDDEEDRGDEEKEDDKDNMIRGGNRCFATLPRAHCTNKFRHQIEVIGTVVWFCNCRSVARAMPTTHVLKLTFLHGAWPSCSGRCLWNRAVGGWERRAGFGGQQAGRGEPVMWLLFGCHARGRSAKSNKPLFHDVEIQPLTFQMCIQDLVARGVLATHALKRNWFGGPCGPPAYIH